jgi:hypothetical protein
MIWLAIPLAVGLGLVLRAEVKWNSAQRTPFTGRMAKATMTAQSPATAYSTP